MNGRADASSVPDPPAAVVAGDAHWAAKMARLRARRLPERTVSVCDDEDAKHAFGDATMALAQARAAASTEAADQGVAEADRDAWTVAHPRVLAADEALEHAQTALDAATVELTFRALPRPVWEQLLRDHPPTEPQADEGMEYNVDTFPAAVIAACHVERDGQGREVAGMTRAQAQELLDAWPDAEAKILFTAALTVNQTVRADLGKG